jgi:hypothetical protein
VVAVIVKSCVVPSGSVKPSVIFSPAFGLPVKLTLRLGGGPPPGPVTVALDSV